ncbi:Rv0361 family membrane protein [Nocardia sp. IFM 10818]
MIVPAVPALTYCVAVSDRVRSAAECGVACEQRPCGYSLANMKGLLSEHSEVRMNPNGEPTPIRVDGWTYYPTTPQSVTPMPPLSQSPPPSGRRTNTPLIIGLIAAAVVLFGGLIAIGAAAVHRDSGPSAAADDKAEIETATRRFLGITTTDDPVYPQVTCAAYRRLYASWYGEHASVSNPPVLQVNVFSIDGDRATARVTADIGGGQAEQRDLDLIKEDGHWKACPVHR